MSSILFHEEKATPWFKGRRIMKSLLAELFTREKTPIDHIQFILTTDEHVLDINKQFLKHDYYTDIITFDLSNSSKDPKLADVFISVDRVRDNAAMLDVPREVELRRVMIHGCLHLCGYKDKLNADKAEMRSKEDFYLRLYNKRST